MDKEKSILLANMLAGNNAVLDQIIQAQDNIDEEEDKVTHMMEVMQTLDQADAMSMNPTPVPSVNAEPSLSSEPSPSPIISPKPSISTSTPSASPSAVPSTSPTTSPTSSPAAGPTSHPSDAQTEMPTVMPTTAPIAPSVSSLESHFCTKHR